jgi:hypothetical protein
MEAVYARQLVVARRRADQRRIDREKVAEVGLDQAERSAP